MSLAVYTHPCCVLHNMGMSHPESPERLKRIHDLLKRAPYCDLPQITAEEAPLSAIAEAHPMPYIHFLQDNLPDDGLIALDSDTLLCPESWEAALTGAGAVCQAVDDVLAGKYDAAFCATRPPGHHAMPEQAMGFCFFNNVFIGARQAQKSGKAPKVAIVDFDVHHGNGTDYMARHAEDIFFASSHQFPLYPGTGDPKDNIAGKILNIALNHGDGSNAFRAVYEQQVFPALEEFSPDILMISAGFDAHKDDPLGGLNLTAEDFFWVTKELKTQTASRNGGKIVSVLEGGYNIDALEDCVSAHLDVLTTASA